VETIQQILSVLLVLALVACAAWFLTKRGGGQLRWPPRARRRTAALEAVERLPLSAQHSLHLVRLADRALLVASHGGGCTLIETRPWSELEGSGARGAAGAPR
jgi:flagellar biogenesis protein FliO